MIWARVPKEVLIGSDFLSLGVYHAAAHFKIGSIPAVIHLLNDVDLTAEKVCLEECSNSDKLRVWKANYKACHENKKQRKTI